MQESHFQTADAGDSLLDSRCRSSSIGQWRQDNLDQTADAGALHGTADAVDSLSDDGCRSLSFRQRMQVSFYQTADAGDSLSDSGRRRHSI